MSKDLLKLIETVSPDDAAMLDEIDARVWCWLHDAFFIKFRLEPYEDYFAYVYAVEPQADSIARKITRYTRSRDALKAIRPEGFEFPMDVLTNGSGFIFGYGCPAFNNGQFLAGYSRPLPTEELAELHAIIQAIQWERDNNE